MLKLQRYILAVFAILAFSNANAVEVKDYTKTFASNSLGVYSFDLLSVGAAVIYNPQLEESRIDADMKVYCLDSNCDDSARQVSSRTYVANVGEVYVDDTILFFEPYDKDFTGTFTIDYEVLMFQASTGPTAKLTISVGGVNTNTDKTNLKSIVETVVDICADTDKLTSAQVSVCSALASDDTDDVIDALSTISPEEVVAEFTSTVNMTKDQTSNLFNRLSALRGGAKGVSLAGLNYHRDGETLSGRWLHEMVDQVSGNASADENFSPLGFFINGSITSGDKDTTEREQGYDLDADSITMGVDYRFNESLVAGFAYGMSESEIKFAESDNTMDNEIDNYLIYGSWYKDAFYLDSMLGYAKGDIDTRRDFEVGSIEEVITGSTESSQMFFSISGNYDFYQGAWTFGPYANFDYIDGEIDGYEEKGNTGFEVTFEDQDIESQVITLGGRVQYALSQSWGVLVPHARAEWKNELEDDRDVIVGRFALDTSDDAAFAIQADELDDNWFQVGVGLSATFQYGLSAYIDYESVISYDDTDIETWSFGGRWETKF